MYMKKVVAVAVFLQAVAIVLSAQGEDESKENAIGLQLTRTARQFVSSLVPSSWRSIDFVNSLAMPMLAVLFVTTLANVSSVLNFDSAFFV